MSSVFMRMRDRGARHVPLAWPAARVPFDASCVSGTQSRSRLKQGIPATLWRRLVSCLALSMPSVTIACGAHAPHLEPWPSAIEGVWWVRAERGEADASNRGVVSNLLIVRDGRRVWAVGSGPSPAFGVAASAM